MWKFSWAQDRKIGKNGQCYVELLADYGVNDKILQLATGNDAFLDHAIACYLDIDEDEIEDDYIDDLNFWWTGIPLSQGI